jgi:formate/nitrite transporter FocA (FNT family)
MAVMKRAIPWWSIPVNWTVGKYRRNLSFVYSVYLLAVFFGNLVGSLFFAAILSKCQFAFIGLD